ncbi:hypothetical protein DZF99_14135, partial [Clavibacter phaseoli]
DDDLAAALDGLLAAGTALTRRLLGSGGPDDGPAYDPDEEGGAGYHVVTARRAVFDGSYEPAGEMGSVTFSSFGMEPDGGPHGFAQHVEGDAEDRAAHEGDERG